MIDIALVRQALHEIPELAFNESKTKALLLHYLDKILPTAVYLDNFSLATLTPGWSIYQFKQSNGILVCFHQGKGSYRLFRADMDALPVIENCSSSFPSLHPGLMHACGHDVHMAILIGLIQAISKLPPSRNFLFLFQPAEEGKGGAESILAEGVVQQFTVDSAIALHVASELPVGTISTKAGIFFGIPQEFDVQFIGKASHVAYPEKGINALSAGLDFISRMNTSIAALNATERVIFNVGKMEAGTIRNIIPAKCLLEGTHRSLKKQVRNAINQMITTNATLAAANVNAETAVDFLCSYEPVVNNEGLVQELIEQCHELGYKYTEAETAMTGEDFGFFTTLYPGLLFWLGSGCDYPLHSDKFLPLEECIEVGIKLMLALAL